MKADQHPEIHIEQEYLQKTLTALDGKLDRLQHGRYLAGDMHAHNALVEQAVAEYERLRSSRLAPYVARLDFKVQGEVQSKTYYIGKVGFEHDGIQVYDWRAGIGELMHHISAGRVTYYGSDGPIHGTLFLKRIFEIQMRQLESIIDQFDARKGLPRPKSVIIDPDSYLNQVLQKRQDIQLHDIVATIQREQDTLIRADGRQILAIQGAAGSGKTSIALHRLAYLLYPGTKSGITPSRCIIFGPNRLFLNYIALVLPSLGVHGIPQKTLADWESEQIGLTDVTIADQTLDVIMSSDASREDKATNYTRSRIKTSHRMGQLLERYAEYRRGIHIPEAGLSYLEVGKLKVTLGLTQTQIQEIYRQFSQLPVSEHRRRFLELVTSRILSQYDQAVRQRARELATPGEQLLEHARKLHEQAEQMDQWAEEARATDDPLLIEKRTDQALLQGASGLEELSSYYHRQGESVIRSADLEREDALNKDLRKQTLDHIERQIRRDVDRLWRPIELPNDYYSLLGNRVLLEDIAQGIFATDQINLLSQETAHDHSIDMSDLPALVFLNTIANGVTAPPFEHMIIDEAQDVSPLEFETLRRYSRNSSLTILGDIAQSIYAHRGIANWDETKNAFPNLKYQFFEITKSYRSTYEIMSFAKKALQTIPRKGRPVALPDPLKRHGAPLQLHKLQDTDELATVLKQLIEQIQEEDHHNIAIICKTNARCSVIADMLDQVGVNLSLATSSDFNYAGGTIVVPVHLAKGMEFEATLAVDVDANTYTDTEFDGRLLYVVLTRALHVLHIIWSDRISTHLEKVVETLEKEELLS